jgi:asparagine synthase (glutamine-hydrolysing)
LMNRAPKPARQLLARAIAGVSPATWDNIAGAVSPILPTQLRVRRPGDKSEGLAALLNADRSMIAYRSMVSGWQHPEAIVKDGSEESGSFEHLLEAKGVGSLVDRMMLADQGVYLPDDLLTKTDRASMAVSLEVRVPLLDHRVVEFAWRIPLSMKIRDGRGKWLLRQVLHRHVPPTLVERPKMGFEVPIAAWLRGSLRPWGEELLSAERLRTSGLNAEPIRRAWTELHGGRGNMTHALWAVLMYQAWQERWLS